MGEKLTTFLIDEDKKYKLDIALKRERMTLKQLMTEAIDDFLKKHGESGNPQSNLIQFVKEEVMAIPNLYEENPEIWKKFFNHKNFNKNEYDLLEKQHKMFTEFMNKKYKEIKNELL